MLLNVLTWTHRQRRPSSRSFDTHIRAVQDIAPLHDLIPDDEQREPIHPSDDADTGCSDDEDEQKTQQCRHNGGL